MEWLGDKAHELGQTLTDATGSPVIGTLGNMFVQIAPFAAGGAAIHEVNARNAKANYLAQQKYIMDIIGKVKDGVDIADVGMRPPYEMPEGVDPKEHFQTMIKNGANIVDILDVMSRYDVADDPALMKIAAAYKRSSGVLGLDMTKLASDAESAAQLADRGSKARYQMASDTILADGDHTTPAEFLHEVGHAILGHAIDLWRKVKDGTATDGEGNRITLDTMSAEMKDMYYRVEDLNKVFDRAQQTFTEKYNTMGEKSGINVGLTKEFWADRWDARMTPEAMRAKYPGLPFVKGELLNHWQKTLGDHYGLSDLHEFATEVMANKNFRQLLEGEAIHPLDKSIPRAKLSKNPFSKLWEIAKTAVKRVLVPNAMEGDTLLSYSWDHVTDMIDHMTPDIRGWDMEDFRRPEDAAVSNKQAKWNISLAQDRLNELVRANELVTNRHAKVYLYTIANILKRASSPEEVLSQMRMMDGSSAWQSFVGEQGERILQQAKQMITAFGKDNTWGKMDKAMRLQTATHLNVDDFMAEHKALAKELYTKEGLEFEDQIKTKDDILDDGTFFLPDTQVAMTKGQGAKGGRRYLGGILAKFMKEKGEEYRAMKSQVNYGGLQMIQNLKELPIKLQREVFQNAMYWGTVEARKTLQAMQLQWPTRDMIKERFPNISERSLDAIESSQKMLDYGHGKTNEARIKQGLEPIPQIPGYFPAFYEGPYRALVHKRVLDAEGKVTDDQLMYVKGFQTRYGVQNFIKELESGKHDDGNVQWRPQLNKDTGLKYEVHEKTGGAESLSQMMMQTHLAFKNIQGVDARTLAAVERIEMDAMRGSMKHVLERHDIGGYRGDLVDNMGFRYGLADKLGLNGYNNRILKTFDTYMKNVSEYYGNTMFMADVMEPLLMHQKPGARTQYYGNYIGQVKNLREYMTEYTKNFTGENSNHLERLLDDELKVTARDFLGLDPMIFHRFLKSARNFLSISKLRGNVGFYLGNFIQPLHALSMLTWSNEMLRQSGHKVDMAAPLKAFIRAIENRNDPALQESLRWARENHILDDAMLEYALRSRAPSTIMNIIHTTTGGKLNPGIEMMARSFTFAVAHEFFKDVYKDDVNSTRRAAQNIMNMVNVNYDRTSRPLMYQNWGIAGESMSPFAVYRNAYIGNNWLMFRAMHTGGYSPKSFLPFLTFQMVYLATAGAVGLVFMDEWDQLASMWNKINPESHMPSGTEAMMKFQELSGAPDSMMFGVPSTASKGVPGLDRGVNVGSSLSASGLDAPLSTPILPFLKDAGSLALVLGKGLGHLVAPGVFDAQSFANIWAPAESLVPQPAKGLLEHYATQGRDIGMKSSHLEGYVTRTEGDWRSMLATGRISLEEWKARMQNRAVAELEDFRTRQLKQLVSSAVDSMQGLGSQTSVSEAMSQAQRELQVPAGDFMDMLQEEYMKRISTVREREAREPPTPTGIAKQQLRGALGQYRQ